MEIRGMAMETKIAETHRSADAADPGGLGGSAPKAFASSPAHQVLRETFGYDTFRPGQEEVIDALANGSNVLAVMPTGSGKSLCYQIPALLRGGLTLVVSPLIALMEDQVSALELAGVEAAAINSSKTREENLDIWYKAIERPAALLYLAPERLMTDRMLSALQKQQVRLLNVDEAHCISKWGPAFRPEYEALAGLCGAFPGVPIGAFTATADETTRLDITQKLFAQPGKTFVSGFDRPNIHLSVERNSPRRQIVQYVKDRAGQSGIVYCLSRKDTENVAKLLNQAGVKALPYHAGMSTQVRSEHQDEFMTRSGLVMVATIAFGMGIDKPDIRYVFHSTIPGSVEAYYQELGRAGRDGERAEALMFYGLDDIRRRRGIIDADGHGNEDHRRREHKRFDALIGYCETAKCRRQVLLGYFGEEVPPCGNCDLCENPPEVINGLQPAQKVLAAVQETGQCFGQAHVIDVLLGADNQKIRKFKHDRLPVYGTGSEFSKNEWRSLVHQLVAAGFLAIDYKEYGGLSQTFLGGELEKGNVGFNYRRDTMTRRRAPKPKTADIDRQAPLAQESENERSLFGRLKELRLRLARERSVPAFVVFHDTALREMAALRPKTKPEFAAIRGVGAQKLEKFADAFLDEIRAFENEGS